MAQRIQPITRIILGLMNPQRVPLIKKGNKSKRGSDFLELVQSQVAKKKIEIRQGKEIVVTDFGEF